MTFSICSLIQLNQNFSAKAEEIPILSTPQIVTGTIDLIAIVVIIALAVWMLSNHSSRPLEITMITTQMLPYILLGGAAFIALADMIALAIQTSKKFKTLTEELKAVTLGA